MLAFAPVVTVLRRRKRRQNPTRVHSPPLWRLLLEEVIEAGRKFRQRHGGAAR